MIADPWIGRTVGRYRIESPAGRGGMGVVYRGVQASLRRSVAIKVLPPDLAEDEEFVRRFHQEAQAIAGLAHENIVYVLDIEEHEGTTFIVMEFIDGASLAASREGGPLPPGEVRRIGVGVARALGHAHERGIIHRDVKPANVMLTRDGRVKLTDFGIARVEGGLKTQTGSLPGTPAYMAPEQLQTGHVSPRSDIYSLGVLLFELATGRLPWKGGDPISSALRRISEEPPPARELNPHVPEWLERVILKAMARDSGSRYASAAELEHDLLRAGLPMPDESPAATAYGTLTSPTAFVTSPRRTPPPLPGARGTAPPPAAPATPATGLDPTVPASTPRPPRALVAATVVDSSPPSASTTLPARRRPLVLLLAVAGALAVALGGFLAVFLAREGGAPVPRGPDRTPIAPAAATVRTAPPAGTTTPAAPAEPGSVTVVELLPTAPPPRPTRTSPPAAVAALQPTAPLPPDTEPGLAAFGLDAPPAVAGTFHCRRGAEFNVSPEEAVVTVDGKAIGTADDWDGKGGGQKYVFKRPGAHYVRLDLAGYRTSWVKVVVSPTADDEFADVDTELDKERKGRR